LIIRFHPRASTIGLLLLQAVLDLWLSSLDKMNTNLPSLNTAAVEGDYALRMRQFQSTGDSKRALLLASRLLDQGQVSTKAFTAALDALLWATEDPRPWVPKVERAYHGLSSRQKKSARSLMLYFYGHAGLHEQTASFAPRRYRNLMDLAFVMSAHIQLGDLVQARHLVPKCLLGIKRAEFAGMKLWLIECLADFYFNECSQLANNETTQ
jgi:hypothetical protein